MPLVPLLASRWLCDKCCRAAALHCTVSQIYGVILGLLFKVRFPPKIPSACVHFQKGRRTQMQQGSWAACLGNWDSEGETFISAVTQDRSAAPVHLPCRSAVSSCLGSVCIPEQ